MHDCWKNDSFDNIDLCQQSNVSAFQHAVEVCNRFPVKKQSFSDFMAAVTIRNDFRVQEEEILSPFPLLFAMK